jgi:hypothetical protein
MRNLLIDMIDFICGILAVVVFVVSFVTMQFTGHVFILGVLVSLGLLTFVLRDHCVLWKYIHELFEEEQS